MQLIGYFLAFGYMLMQFSAKYLSRSVNLPNYVILMVRSSFIFMCMLPILLLRKNSLNTENLPFQFLRSLIGAGTIYFTYTGYQKLPLAVAASIGGFEPIFAAFWGFFLGHESLQNFLNLLPIASLGFISILLFSIQKPMTGSYPDYTLGICCMILANLASSSMGYLVKRLNKNDRTVTTVSYSALFTLCISSTLILLLSYASKPFDFARIAPYKLQLSLIGFAGVFSSWFVISSLRHLDPSTLIAVSNLSIPLSSIVGFTIDKEAMTPLNLVGLLAAIITVYLTGNRKNFDDDRLKFLTLIAYIFVVMLTIFALQLR